MARGCRTANDKLIIITYVTTAMLVKINHNYIAIRLYNNDLFKMILFINNSKV